MGARKRRRSKFLFPWRAQGDRDNITGATDFDEVVVSDWLHAEAMDRDHVWVRVGPLTLNVSRRKGKLTIRIAQEREDPACEVVLDDILPRGDLRGSDGTE